MCPNGKSLGGDIAPKIHPSQNGTFTKIDGHLWLSRKPKLMNELTTFDPPRRFQLWDGHVSFSQILFRSTATDEFTTNYDIRLFGVDYLDVPWSFRATEIVKPLQNEFARIETRLGRAIPADGLLVIVNDAGLRFYIATAGWSLDEFEGDFWAPALTYIHSNVIDPGKRPKWVWK